MPAPMTRCECHGVPFKQVARCADANPGLGFKAVMKKAGCGQTCTACHCDLKDYLRAHSRNESVPRTVPITPIPATVSPA
jgi:bacterioferritin-associated ferredoxin